MRLPEFRNEEDLQSEDDLANDSSAAGGNLDRSVRGARDQTLRFTRVALPEDDAQQWCHEPNSEDVVSVGEEAYAGNDTGSNMIPSERRFVDLFQGKTAAFIRIGNVREIVVEVVESMVSAAGDVRHDHTSVRGNRNSVRVVVRVPSVGVLLS